MKAKELLAELRMNEDKIFPVVITQRESPDKKWPRTTCELEVRNVADKRSDDGHEAHIEVMVWTQYKGRTNSVGASVILTREAAVAMAMELLGGRVPTDGTGQAK